MLGVEWNPSQFSSLKWNLVVTCYLDVIILVQEKVFSLDNRN